MAPAQATGEAVDGRTDIYALGCVAYWLVTGQLVFRSRTALETMAHHLRTQPVPPSQRSEVPIPPALDRLILSCLEKDPSRRPQSAEQLDVLLDGCEVETPWTPERAREWWDAHEPAAAGSRDGSGGRIQVV
jgi:serine/threonine-protein kinase